MGRTWFNYLFWLPFKLKKAELLICSRYVDADPRRYSYKIILQNYAVNLYKGSLQDRSLINSMHAPSTTPRIALSCFHLLKCKILLQVFWTPQWYFVTYATRSIKLEHLKSQKKVLKSLNENFEKPQALEDETKLHSKKFELPIAYLKSYLKICLY